MTKAGQIVKNGIVQIVYPPYDNFRTFKEVIQSGAEFMVIDSFTEISDLKLLKEMTKESKIKIIVTSSTITRKELEKLDFKKKIIDLDSEKVEFVSATLENGTKIKAKKEKAENQ
ncbi:MAG: hypothetical protein ACTSUT_10620 [Promethearchaeota archaeon]